MYLLVQSRRATGSMDHVNLTESVCWCFYPKNTAFCLCSESELEEVLTVYTRLSRSAVVFLRTSSRHGPHGVATTQATAPPAPSSSSSVSVSPVKGQESLLSSSKPRSKDQSAETRARQPSLDRQEGAVHCCTLLVASVL